MKAEDAGLNSLIPTAQRDNLSQDRGERRKRLNASADRPEPRTGIGFAGDLFWLLAAATSPAHLIAPAALGTVERLVRGLDHVCGCGALAVALRDTDADRD